MKTSAAALELIREFEGFVPRWYRDPVGVWTIGYGHTDAAGSPKHATSANMVLSEEEGSAILQRDLGQYEAAVTRAVKVPLNENQFGALVSFTYNLGAGNLNSSTLVKKLNAKDYKGAAAEFARWNKAGGKVLNGLVRRRAAEKALFERPVSRKPPVYDAVPASGASSGKGIAIAVGAIFAAVAAWLGFK